MTHTKGPWTATPEYFGQSDHLDPPYGEPPMVKIGEIAYPVSTNDDARLIAAAPELLEACKATLAILDADKSPWDYGFLRAAIAKAEGEQHAPLPKP